MKQRNRRVKCRLLYLAIGLPVLSVPPVAGAQEQDASQPSLPMTKTVVSRETLDAQNPQDGYEALQNVAGVTSANSKGSVNDSLNVRGINANLYTSYRLNGGLPIATVIATPAYDKERIEALKGANALMFGIASPAGILNLVTKRATSKDVNSLSVSGNSFGQLSGAVDIGRKLGEDKQFGVRVNLADTHIETGVKNGGGRSNFASVAGDWNPTRNLGFRLDVEHYTKDAVEQGAISLLKAVNGVIVVPRVPDPTKLLSGPWARYVASTDNVMFGTDLKLSGNWKVVAEAGQSRSKRARRLSRVGKYNVETGEGVNSITVVDDQRYINDYAKTELRGSFDTGPLRHGLTLGVAAAQRDSNVPSTTTVTATQNIYEPRDIPAPPAQQLPLRYLPQSSRDVGLYGYDTVSVGPQWKVLLGMRQTKYRADNATPFGKDAITRTATPSPAFGLLYQLEPKTTVYASYMKGLEETGIAAVGTANQFVTLPPAPATQAELGIRTSFFTGVNASAAYFNITRANAITDAHSNMFLLDGSTRLQGIETTLSAQVSRELSIDGAAQLMRAVERPMIDTDLAGLMPENIPKLAGNVSLSYRPVLMKGWTFNAGASYVGPRFVNPKDEGQIPGVVLFNVGAAYAIRLGGHGLVLRAGVDNLADKAYWNSIAGSAYGTGMVRSIKASAKFDY